MYFRLSDSRPCHLQSRTPAGAPVTAKSKIKNQKSRISRTPPARGFTLLEILLVIALLALMATVLMSGVVHWVDQQPVAPEDVFWKSVQESRKAALKLEHEVRLKFDKDKKSFLLIDGNATPVPAADGVTPAEIPAMKELPIPNAPQDLEMDFLAPMKGGPAILVRGVLVESNPVPYVTFYPDGTCSPFRLQIFRPGGASTLGVDPWTCAPILEKKDIK
jgi:prepilin-type N-terminal cleavage/methylation domain-containing protein